MKRVVLYIRDSFKMHSYLHLDTILLNPRNVHSTAPHMADSAFIEGKSKMKQKQKAHIYKMRKGWEWNCE